MAITKENQQVEVFDKYLRNQMDSVAKAEFERQLDHDGNLRRQLEHYRILMNALRKASDAEFRTHFKDFASNLDTRNNLGGMISVGWRFVIVGSLSFMLFAALIASAYLCMG